MQAHELGSQAGCDARAAHGGPELAAGREALEQLQLLTRRLVETQEAERRKVSRELLDLIGQNLTALNINLDIVRGELAPVARPDVQRRIAEMKQLLEQTIDSVRSVIGELRPAALDECGLAATLHQYAARFRERSDCHVNVSADPLSARPAHDTELALFRIVQEALSNVARHSGAHYARVVLRGTGRGLLLTVQDYGCGFASPPKPIGPTRQACGIAIMRERAAAAGGRLRIESEPGAGTRVIVDVPCIEGGLC
jgi:two-component system sensor histidine kinase UhpB